MEELMSLKWTNHNNGFLKLLKSLRTKDAYTDVTLACDGELYNAHKIVLSASSDYFNQIFETVLCPNPVIVLKDITGRTFEAILDYIYLGEVNVRECELASVIQAGECLKLKGLAVPDSDITDDSDILDSKKKSLDSSLIMDDRIISGIKRKQLHLFPNGRKCLRSHDAKDAISSRISKAEEKSNIVIQKETNINYLSITKMEDNLDDTISIKSETDTIIENIFHVDGDLNYDTSNHNMSTEINSIIKEDDTTQAPFIMNPHNETTNINEEISSNMANKSMQTTRSPQKVDNMIKAGLRFQRKRFCKKKITPSSNPERRKTHTGKKRHACDYCSYKAVLLGNLKRHITIHTGDRPFPCDYCSFKACQLSLLKRHIRVHTGERPFACTYCSYKSARKCTLKDHIAAKHKK